MLYGVKPGEVSTGGVWEVEKATPGTMLTILPVRGNSKDAQCGMSFTCHFQWSYTRAVAACDSDSSSLVLEYQPSHSTDTGNVWSSRNSDGQNAFF